MQEAWGRRGRRPGRPRRSAARCAPRGRVLALIAVLAVVGAVLWAGLLAYPPDPPLGLQIPWWLLALMFAVTEIWVFHIQVGREAQSISISEVPLILALFYAMPQDLLVARVVGSALVMLLHRRQTLLKSGVNAALMFADTTVALVVFRSIGGGSTADGGREWVARGRGLRGRDGRRPGRPQPDHPVVRRQAAAVRRTQPRLRGRHRGRQRRPRPDAAADPAPRRARRRAAASPPARC